MHPYLYWTQEETFEEKCHHHHIYKTPASYVSSNRCGVIGQTWCDNGESMINFYLLHFCVFAEQWYLFLSFSAFFIFLNFKYLAILVDEYLAEGITKISDWLNFSEALAACTLLAFANGAGDVITALVASGAEGGVFYNIGWLYGAGLFCCCAVVAMAIYMNKKSLVFDKMIIFRDVSFYIVSTLAVIAFGIYGEVNLVTGIIMILIYFSQVAVVLIEQQRSKSIFPKS